MKRYRKHLTAFLLFTILGLVSAWLMRNKADDGLLHLNRRGYEGAFGFLPEDTLLAVGGKAPALLDSFRRFQDSGGIIEIIGLNHNMEAPAAIGVNRGMQRAGVLFRYLSTFLRPEQMRINHEANGDTARCLKGIPGELVKFRLYDRAGTIIPEGAAHEAAAPIGQQAP